MSMNFLCSLTVVVPEDNLYDLFSGLIKYGNNNRTCSTFLSKRL